MVVPTLGADIEIGNAWTGNPRKNNLDAAGKVVREVDRMDALQCFGAGVPSVNWHGEWGRRWLVNGGCIYVDMAHVELCTPETAGARDHASAFHAMVRIIRSCRRRAVARLPAGEDLFVNVHVSDGTLATSWGAHQNVAVSRRLWNDIFHSGRPHVMALLASVVAAMVPVFGQGLVVPLDDGCRFATSARAHHLGSLVTLATTEAFNRGLLNSRDEAHAGSRAARLHLIAFDANLMPATIMMRSGLLQLAVAALELGWFDARLLLDDPVAAVRAWSFAFCPQSGALRPSTARRPGAPPIGLFEWHQIFLANLRKLVDRDRIPDSIVPEGAAILDLWNATLDDLIHENATNLATRLDWALKWQILRQLETAQGRLDLDDPRLRLLDQLYGHVDDRIGLFWQFWRDGLVDPVIDRASIGRFMKSGDPRTRSGLRGELVGRLGPWIADLNWSVCELERRDSSWSRYTKRQQIILDEPGAPSGPLVAELRAKFPENHQLLDYLMQQPDGFEPARLPALTTLEEEETSHDHRALPSS
jgi:Pup-ligase protein